MNFIIIFVLQLLSIFIWGFLIKTYSLVEFANIPFFALDKIPGHFSSPTIKNTLIAFILLSIIYSINLWLLKKIKNSYLQLIFKIVVLATIFLPVFIYPVGAIDIFDYIAQSKLFYFYRQNPYITLYSSYPNDIFWGFTGFLSQNLIYGPVWLITTMIPNLFINFNSGNSIFESLFVYKIFNLLLLFLSGFFITKLHYSKHDKNFFWYSFVGNPLVLFEVLVNGHNDILIAMFLILTIIFSKQKPYVTCIFISLASLVKIYFLILIPLLLIRYFLKKYPIADIFKSLIYSIIIPIIFYFPFIFNTNPWQIIKSIYGSQNLNTYSVYSLIREYLVTNNFSINLVYLSQFIILLIFFIIAIFIVFKTTNSNISIPIFIILNLFIILLTFSHPWYFVVTFAVISCFKPKNNTFFLISLTTLLMLCFYPLSVWLWFNSGFSIFKIHLFQSLFIIPPVLLSSIYSYYSNSNL